MNSQSKPSFCSGTLPVHDVVAAHPLSGIRSNLPLLIGGLLVCAGYYIGSKLGLALTIDPRPVSVMWPPNSILLAALLLAPARHWPFLLACALPAHFWVQMHGEIPLMMTLCWFVSNATEAVIGAGLTRWIVCGHFQLSGRAQVAAFLLCGGFLGPFFSSFLDAAFVRLNNFGEGSYFEIWKIRFFANVLAALTIAPMILLWARMDYRRILNAGWKQWLEGSLLGTGLLCVGYLVFLRDQSGIAEDPAFICVPLPFLLWAAVRFGAIGAVTAVFVTSLISISGAAHGFGPFATRAPEANALLLQIFLSLTSVLLLLLCAVITDLEQAREHFAKVFHSSPGAMLVARKRDGQIMEWNERAEKLFGYTRPEAVGATLSDLKVFLDEDNYRGLWMDTRGAPAALDVSVQNKSGETRHTVLSAETDEIAGATCMILALHDVTERRRLEEETQELNRKLVSAKEDERKRIARELHDDLNQRLALLAVEVDLLNEQTRTEEPPNPEQLEAIGSQLRELSTEVDRFSHQLHPAQLEQLGLASAAQAYCEETEQRWSVRVHFIDRGHIPRNMDPLVALCVYRVLQEALQNAVRHSESSEMQVKLTGEEDQIRLVVTDKGKGFDVRSAQSTTSLGMVSMRERVKQVFGSLEIHSRPGQETRIDVTIPLLSKKSSKSFSDEF